MKPQPQSNSDLGQLARLIEGIDVAMLTRTAADGTLLSRPMAPLEMDADGALWFFTDARTESTLPQAAVNLAFCNDARAIYVSVAGRASLVHDREHIHALWTPLGRPWFPEGPHAEPLALLKVEPDVVDYWDAPHSKLLRLMAVAAAAVADLPRPAAAPPREPVRALAERRRRVAARAGGAPLTAA